MIIKIEQNPAQRDIEVLITCPAKSKTVDRIVSLIKSVDTQIECYLDDSIKQVNVSDIYFIESIDGKTIACCEKEKYLIKSRLYQIYDKLKGNGFIQISKYCIMNINKLDRFKPLDNNRLEAVLSNGVYLCITRKYIAGIKQILRGVDK
jgi:DNA-binding LytR/AlgR family response regulator